MNTYKLTAETLERASTYMPIMDKQKYAKEIAEACVTDEGRGREPQTGAMILPPVVVEDYALKEILLMNVLLGHYLDIELNPLEYGNEIYDQYASGNLLEQLKRFKGTPELCEKAHLILEDFHRFEKMVNTEIFNRKLIKNDILSRIMASIELGTDPENIKKAIESLKDIDEEKLKKLFEKQSEGKND